MALKTQTYSGSSTGYTLELTLTENSTDINANTSSVSYTLKLVNNSNQYFQMFGIGASVQLDGYTVATRDRYGSPQLSITQYGSITLLSGSTTIGHNSDGSKTMAVAFSISMSKTSFTPGPISVTGQSMTLTTIPRATAPSVSGTATLGSSKTISISPASSSFTHTLLYSFGNASGTIASGIKSSVSWTPPLSLASQIPNAISGTATITCHTYSGSTLIGTKTTTMTLQVPSNIVPTISGVTLSEATSGIAAQFGVYVQSKSALKVQISASSQYGATIRSYSTTVLGTTYTGSTITTGILSQSGTVSISVKVTDSRGRTATTTKSISVVSYSSPQISSFSVSRVDNSGNADDEGTRLKVAFELSISPVSNKNTKQYKLLYKRKSDTFYTTLQTVTPSAYSYSDTLTFTDSSYPEFSPDYGYDIRLQVSDYFTSVNNDDELQTAAVWLDFNISGKGIGIGKVSEKDVMEVAWPVEFNENVTHYGGNLLGEITLTVAGSDKDTYYPVHIQIDSSINTQTFFLGIGKKLGSPTPPWSGNHSGGTSSFMIGFEFRANGWDGNGNIVKTLYKDEPYETIIAHAEIQTGAAKGIVVWLRGGGAEYKIVSSGPILSITPYYSTTNIGSSSSVVNVSPRSYSASGNNFGVVYDGIPPTQIGRGGTGGKTEAEARKNLAVPSSNFANGYYGLGRPDGRVDDYLRAPQNGIIPYQSGGNGNLGTSGWPWTAIYGNAVYAPTLGWTTLWSGTLSSGSITVTNGRKYAAIIVGGIPGSGESYVSACLPCGQWGTLQLASNLYYISYNVGESGNNLTISVVSNPSGGSIRQVWGIVRYQA